jgi:hypothetical protein
MLLITHIFNLQPLIDDTAAATQERLQGVKAQLLAEENGTPSQVCLFSVGLQ